MKQVDITILTKSGRRGERAEQEAEKSLYYSRDLHGTQLPQGNCD